MKIFDCFKFFNELELLDLRIMTLKDFADYFVLVEANKTHTGHPKEFIFEQHKDKFAEYLDRIIYVKVEDLPDYSPDNIWIAENFQRNCINRGLEGRIELGDKVIISDIDEIPNPDTLKMYLQSDEPVTMVQYLFYYYVNCRQISLWRGSIMATYNKYESPQALRDFARHSGIGGISQGGWHYSFMGGAARIKEKVENIAESHMIINEVGTVEEIRTKMKTQKDLWNRVGSPFHKQIVNIYDGVLAPKCIKQFVDKYPDFFFVPGV